MREPPIIPDTERMAGPPVTDRALASDPLDALLAVAYGPPVDEGPGTMIGPYKLREKIGEGGMGLVFVAEQQGPVRRRVAIKVIKPGMDSRQVIARFEAERQALALMDHPNIARVFDGGETVSGRPYFVMELVKGAPITDFCDQNRLPMRDRLELFIHVCQAVQHAHQKGIIHRDLKPSNVLVTVHDGIPVVKVIDFGVAKAVGQQLTENTLYTQLNQLLGTPLYMSPEQAGLSGLDVDTRSDIYALGVLLYELLTGTTPFDETRFKTAAYDEIRRIIREEDPPRPSTRVSTLGAEAATVLTAKRQSDPRSLSQFLRGELDWIVMRCLEKDRRRRYETANALVADVTHYLKDEQVLACPPSAWYRFRKFARRHRKVLAGVTAGVALILLTVVLLAVSNVRIGQEQEETKKALTAQTQAKSELESALKREQNSVYVQRIARADLEWWACNVGRADRILEECAPEYRHWEWRYLKRLCNAERVSFRGHTDTVRTLAIDGNGLRLASAGDDHLVKVWNLAAPDGARGKEALTFRGHQQPVLTVAFSPDGRYIASAGGEWTAGKPEEVKVWEAATGKELFELIGHRAAIAGVVFSPDGKLIATAGWDWTLRLWDVTTGREVRRFCHAGPVKGVAFSSDGRWLAAGGNDCIVTIWNVDDGQKVSTLRGHSSSILSVAFSPDGRRLVSGSWDHTARIWDVSSGRPLLVFRGHTEIVPAVAFAADGVHVASAGGDSSVKLWNSRTGEERRTLRGHSGLVLAVAFSPGGRCLASAGSDHAVKFWDLTTDPQHRTYAWPDSNRPRVIFSPDGKNLASANRRLATRKGPVRVRVFEAQTGRELLALPEHADGCNCVAYRPDGSQLATDWDNTAKTWDARTGREVLTFVGHTAPVTSTAFNHDGTLLATASADQTIKVWDSGTAKEICTLAGHGGTVTAVVFPASGDYLASASDDQSIRVWDVKRRRELAILLGHGGPVKDIAINQNGQRLASAGADGKVLVWDLEQALLPRKTDWQSVPPEAQEGAARGRLVHVLPGHGGPVNAVSFSPDGRRLVSAHEDGTIILWDAHTGQETLSLRRQLTRATSVAFSPNGRWFVGGGPQAGTGANGVIIWEAERDQEPGSLQQLLRQDLSDAWNYRGQAAVEKGRQMLRQLSNLLEKQE